MILDSFKLLNTTFQITYSEAYMLWDRAGEIAERVRSIWPDLKLSEGRPKQQTFEGKDITLQTGLTLSTIILNGENSLDQNKARKIKETFEVWRQSLELHDLQRMSMLTTYAKEFSSMKEANAELIALNIARWPSTKVFDQPLESELNGLEIFFRFEDKDSFSTLKLKCERTIYKVNLDPEYINDSDIESIKNRLLITFDRGMLGTIDAKKFRFDDWVQGYQHVLRRDIEKLIKV